jgi:hypothetical protein
LSKTRVAIVAGVRWRCLRWPPRKWNDDGAMGSRLTLAMVISKKTGAMVQNFTHPRQLRHGRAQPRRRRTGTGIVLSWHAVPTVGEASMNEEHLREQLQRLSAELATLPANTANVQSIQALIADIQAQLDSGTADDSLVVQVEEVLSAFEAEHPSLAGILNNIMVALGSIGV